LAIRFIGGKSVLKENSYSENIMFIFRVLQQPLYNR
jgi:hypothetical protein